MNKNYEIEIYTDRNVWKEKRGIGSTDLAKINGVSRWGRKKEVFCRLLEMYDFKEYEDKNKLLENGLKAENNIINLFLLNHEELKREYGENEIVLVRRNDFKEITLSPDCLVENTETNEKGFIEIKYLDVYNEIDINTYLSNFKEVAKDYYYQVIHYFIAKNDLQFGYFVPCFKIYRKNENGGWTYDKMVIESLLIKRNDIAEEIKEQEQKIIDFITNEIRKENFTFKKLNNEEMEKWKKISQKMS